MMGLLFNLLCFLECSLALVTQNNNQIMKEEPEGRVDEGRQEVAEGRIQIRIAKPADIKYVYPILREMEASAGARGTGIAKRSPQALCQKIYEGKAVIALGEDGDWAGFSYVEAWGNGAFVSNSGLIVNPVYRGKGVARGIKEEIVRLSRSIYPAAKIFSITTGAVVMKLNHEFGFRPVAYAEITRDEQFGIAGKAAVFVYGDVVGAYGDGGGVITDLINFLSILGWVPSDRWRKR